MKKRLLSMGLACGLLLGALVGCGGGAADAPAKDQPAVSDPAAPAAEPKDAGGAKRIAVCMPLRDQFLTTCETYTKEAAEKLGYEVSFFDANGDVSTQISQVTSCALDGYDAILTMVNELTSTKELIDAAGDTKIIFYQRGADYNALKDRSWYVGCDQRDCGKLQAEYIAKYFKDQGKTEANIVLFLGTLGNEATTLRTEAFKQGMVDAGIKVNYVFEDTADWVREKSMDKFVQFMGTGKPYDAVVSNNDDMALGVIEAFTSQGIKEIPVPIVGVDATEGGLRAIKDGTMSFTASQNAPELCSSTVKLMDEIVNGKAPTGVDENGIMSIPPIGIDVSNVDEYLPQ